MTGLSSQVKMGAPMSGRLAEGTLWKIQREAKAPRKTDRVLIETINSNAFQEQLKGRNNLI